MAMLRPIVGPRTLGGGSYDGGGTFAPVSPNDPTTMPIQGAGLPSATAGAPFGGAGSDPTAPGGLGRNPFVGTMPDNIWAQLNQRAGGIAGTSGSGPIYWTDAQGVTHGASVSGPQSFNMGDTPSAGAGGGGGGGGMPSGIDPALAAIYQQGGLSPAGRGTGFADWQYWQGVGPSQYQRLAADIAGTGTDQPTGTPGQGAWMTSGQGGAPAGSAALIHGGNPQVSAGADQILSQVEGNLNNYIRQLLASSGGSDSGNQQQPI